MLEKYAYIYITQVMDYKMYDAVNTTQYLHNRYCKYLQ